MPISVEWVPAEIYVPKDYLTPVGGIFYELDVDQLRLDLGTLYAAEECGPWPEPHIHQAPFVLSGEAYDRFVKILDPYTLDFESGDYVVRCTGANHNLVDVMTSATSPSVLVGNSSGRTIVTQDVPASPVIVLGGDVEVDVLEDEFEVQVLGDHYDILLEEDEVSALAEELEAEVTAEEEEHTAEVEV